MADLNAPKGGIFGIDLIPGIDVQDFVPDLQLDDLLPGPVSGAIKNAIDKILDPNDTSIGIGDPQPPDRPIPVAADSEELSTAVRAIDALVGALNLVLKFGWLIPNKYETPLKGLVAALNTVRGWLD